MTQPYSPLQSALCAYHSRLKDHPYFEPLRAIAPRARVQTSPSQFVLDRMIEALDEAERLIEQDRVVHEALQKLDACDRELVLHLSAYPDSRGQFDFGKAAAVWIVRERGICPGANTPHYAAWLEAKRYRKARLVEAWAGVSEILLQLGLDRLS